MAAPARLRRSVQQLVVATLAVAVVAMAVGWLFAHGDAPAAARLLLDDDVTAEPDAAEPAAAGAPAHGPGSAYPTSGPQRGRPLCGILDAAPTPGQQVAALAAGVVVVHHRDDLASTDLDALQALVDVHRQVLVTPAADQRPAVIATAWRHRYEQTTLDVTDLERFVVGWGGRGPDPRPCP